MNPDRTWNLKLTLPGEPERTIQVPESEMIDVLRGVMRNEMPPEAELDVALAA
jgi:hypothetical protein